MSFADDARAFGQWAEDENAARPSIVEKVRQNRERFIRQVEEFAAGVPAGDATLKYTRENGFTEEEARRLFEAGKALQKAAARIYQQF